MANNYGVKIAKQGFDVKTFLTELNKKNFNILSTEDTFIRKSVSSAPSTTNRFLGFSHVPVRNEIRPLNFFSYIDSYDKSYVIYEDALDE
jgi:hypothetical protein